MAYMAGFSLSYLRKGERRIWREAAVPKRMALTNLQE